MWDGCVLSFPWSAEHRGSSIKQGAGQSGWSLSVCLPPEPWAPPLLMLFPNAPRLWSDAQLRLQAPGLGRGRYAESGPGVGGACCQKTGTRSMFSRCLLVGRREEMGTCDLSETVRSESQGQVAASGRISLGFCNYKLLMERNKEHREPSHQEAINHHLGLAFILPGCLQSHPLSSTRTLIGRPEPRELPVG